MKYTRILTSSESSRHYIPILKHARNMFPASNVKFTLLAKDKPFVVELDKQYRIWVAELQAKFKFEEGHQFEIEKIKDDTYQIRQITNNSNS